MFDLGRLRLLLELAHRGTMTAVGEAVGLTASAVSQQLATLEYEAGVALVERVGRRVRLTAEGEQLVSHTQGILEAVETAELQLQSADHSPRGVVAIASFSTFAKTCILPAVMSAKARYPELHVVIHELEPADAAAALRYGRCHIAVDFTYDLVPRRPIPGIVSHPIMDEPVLLALPAPQRQARGPIALASLSDEEWIVGSRQSDDRLLVERACAAAGFLPRIAHTVDNYDLVFQMIAAGLGVGFVPELALSSASAKAVRLHQIDGKPLRRRIDALTRKALESSASVRAVLAELLRTTSSLKSAA